MLFLNILNYDINIGKMKSSKLFSFEFPKIKSNFYNSIQHSFDYSLSLRNLFFIINDKNKWDLPRNNYNFKITKNENLTFHLLPLNKNREKTHAQNNLIFNKKCYYSINNQSDPDKDKIQASNREKKNHNKKAKTADESFIKSLKSKIKQYGLKGIIIYGIIDCIVLTLLFVSLYMQIIPSK